VVGRVVALAVSFGVGSGLRLIVGELGDAAGSGVELAAPADEDASGLAVGDAV
jgi:hypothetical protein